MSSFLLNLKQVSIVYLFQSMNLYYSRTDARRQSIQTVCKLVEGVAVVVSHLI